jgi:hypothetical protein
LHTSHYKDFKKLLGSSIHNLNTICVGLEQIDNETIAPEALTITWHTNDKVNDAKRARRYAINLFLVASVDAIEDYITSISQYEELLSQKVKQAILNCKSNNKGIREQVKELFSEVKDNPSIKLYWLPSIRLLIAWRNIIVHRSKAKVQLDLSDEKILLCNKEEIYNIHSKTKIEETIKRFKNKEQPSLKDFSTLFTMLLYAFKEFDTSIVSMIEPATIKEMINYSIGIEKFNTFFENESNDLKALKKFCESKGIEYNEEEIYLEVKKKIINYFANKQFNKLIVDSSNGIKKLQQYCLTNSIPYVNKEILKKVLTI